MKKVILLITIIIVFFGFSTKAQIENLKISDQINLDRIYFGVLSASNVNIDSLHVSQLVNVRTGAMATWSITKNLSFGGLSTIDYTGKKDPFVCAQAWVNWDITKNLSIKAGHLGTLSTENRPLHTSATGQFETWSESQIPGGSLNAKIKYVGKNFQAGAGVGIRKNKLEYHAMIGIKDKIKFTA